YTRPERARQPSEDDSYQSPPPYDDYGARTEDFADARQPDDYTPSQDYKQPPEPNGYDESAGTLESGESPPEESLPQQAAPEEPATPAEEWYRHLQSAADRLLSAREVLYPVPIYLLDICLLDEARPAAGLSAGFDQGQAVNLIGASS